MRLDDHLPKGSNMKKETLINSDHIDLTNPEEPKVVRVENYVEDYKALVSKSSTSILELAEFIGKLKNTLSDSRFAAFCKEIGTTHTNAYIKKMYCISKKLSIFNSLKDRLPASYTTLYALTQLSDEKLQEMITKDEINSFMTGMTVARYSEKKKVPNREIGIRIKKEISDINAARFCKELQDLCKKFKIELKLPSSIKLIDQQVSSLDELKNESEEITSVLETVEVAA